MKNIFKSFDSKENSKTKFEGFDFQFEWEKGIEIKREKKGRKREGRKKRKG